MAVNHLDDSWRTWLMTGIRRAPIDRRRIRGAHKGLKKMLVEGMSAVGDRPRTWTKFSGAMIRQAVDDGVRELPSQQKQLVKLAYFGGLSNAEIGERLGLSESGVERGLRQAIATISQHVERGRAAGRRALYAIGLFFCARSIADTLHPAAIVVVAATAGAMISAQPASPIEPTAPAPAPAPAVTTAAQEPAPSAAATHAATTVETPADSRRVSLPPVAGPRSHSRRSSSRSRSSSLT